MMILVSASAFSDDSDVTFFSKLKGKHHYRKGAYIVINAPKDKIFSIIADFDNYKKTMPRVMQSKIVKKEKNKVIASFHFDVLTGLDFTFDYKLKPSSKIEWGLIEGPFRKSEGTWILKKAKDGKGTMVIHTVYFELGGIWGDIIPQVLVDKAIKKVIKGALKSVKKAAEKNS